MDELKSMAVSQNTTLVAFAFLYADCQNTEYRKEIISLEEICKPVQDINCNGDWVDPGRDGDLETDGHLSMPIPPIDIEPIVNVQWPGNHDVAGNIQQVAGELRQIAELIEHRIVAQATRNLKKNISSSPSEDWKSLLSAEVERVMRQGVGLEYLPQERVLIALTLTLVKGVCEQAPRFLRNLFSAAVQFINPVSTW